MSTRTHHGRIIETSIRMKTTPMRAWLAWADPLHIANWFVDRAEGDARPGGTMRWFFDTFGYKLEVPIVEALPGKTFVTGGGDAPGPDGLPYLMEITITKDGDHTVINLVNSGFSEDPSKDENFKGVDSGWKGALAVMKHWLENHPGRMRTHKLIVRPASYTAETLRPLYATEGGRRRWLEPDVAAGGAVLCDTGTEILLAVDDRGAVIALKAFAMGPAQMLALDFSCWPDVPIDTTDVEARLNRALDRLVALL